MSEFGIWFSTGFNHILNWEAYDHILYIFALCIPFTFKDWKKAFLLCTAFTIGHSITLAASVLNWIHIREIIVEIFIPLTIMTTALFQFLNRNKQDKRPVLTYILALSFGFIHGMAFSFGLKSMITETPELISSLFSFNLGIETAQLAIVAFLLLFSVFLFSFTKLSKPQWISISSIVVFTIALFILIQRIIQL